MGLFANGKKERLLVQWNRLWSLSEHSLVSRLAVSDPRAASSIGTFTAVLTTRSCMEVFPGLSVRERQEPLTHTWQAALEPSAIKNAPETVARARVEVDGG